MYKQGHIVLVPFPFTDLSATKIRPALVMADVQKGSSHALLCFITSNLKNKSAVNMQLPANEVTGLKMPSLVKVDQLASIDLHLIHGKIGELEPNHVFELKNVLVKLFGIDPKNSKNKISQ